VDVTTKQLYKAKVKLNNQIEGKLREQYNRVWDYCATLRQTNRGSCMLMKVEMPSLEVPQTFQRFTTKIQ
jgi:hypothetical protein